MNLNSLARSLAGRVAALTFVLGAVGTSGAADTPVAGPPQVLLHASAPCATCAAPAGVPCGPTCATAACRTHFGRPKLPYQTHLCPGACFGYFQTQWSKWEDVCPLPYQEQRYTDHPAQRTTPVTPVRAPADTKKPDTKKDADPKFNKDSKGGELPPPRTGPGIGAIPMGRGTTLPAIPQAPNTLPIPTGRFGS